MPKTSKDKGTEAEKYASNWMASKGYLVEIHPRTSTFTGHIWISRDNDFFNLFDLNCERDTDGAYVQVKYSSRGSSVDNGAVSEAMQKIDSNYPIMNPNRHILIFLVWKEWVQMPGQRRHKEFFHRAWQREVSTDGKPIWIERSVWSNLPARYLLFPFSSHPVEKSV
jgi:hypothetical protein